MPEAPGPFSFDHVFDQLTDQESIFSECGKASINEVIRGFNSTIFAYGQTGSGKTYTLFGNMETPGCTHRGLIPRCVEYLFECLANTEGTAFVKMNFVEIYREKLADLLCDAKKPVKEPCLRQRKNGEVYLENVQEMFVSSFEDVYQVLCFGFRQRHVASTRMNSESSRSHCILRLTVRQEAKSGQIKESVVNFGDLAGSERIAKTGSSGIVLEEAKKINQSLSALGNVINALSKQFTSPLKPKKGRRQSSKGFVPYRNSTLTWMLKDSLGGNTKTCLVITGSLDRYNLEETISTLRFGSRAKNIKCSVKANVQIPRKELLATIKKLKQKLATTERVVGKLKELLEDNKIEIPPDLLKLTKKKGRTNDDESDSDPGLPPMPRTGEESRVGSPSPLDDSRDVSPGTQRFSKLPMTPGSLSLDSPDSLGPSHGQDINAPPFRNTLMLASIQLHKQNTEAIKKLTDELRDAKQDLAQRGRELNELREASLAQSKAEVSDNDEELVEKKGRCKGLMIRFKAIEDHLEELLAKNPKKDEQSHAIQECFEELHALESDIGEEEVSLEKAVETHNRQWKRLKERAQRTEGQSSKFGILLMQYQYLIEQIRRLQDQHLLGDEPASTETGDRKGTECSPFPLAMLQKNARDELEKPKLLGGTFSRMAGMMAKPVNSKAGAGSIFRRKAVNKKTPRATEKLPSSKSPSPAVSVSSSSRDAQKPLKKKRAKKGASNASKSRRAALRRDFEELWRPGEMKS